MVFSRHYLKLKKKQYRNTYRSGHLYAALDPLTHYHTLLHFERYIIVENIVRKGEIACSNDFYFSFEMQLKLSSAIWFSLDQSKILLSGNGLTLPNDNFLDWTKFKLFADDKLNVFPGFHQPYPGTDETQERHEKCKLSLWYDWNTVENGVKHYSINQSISQSINLMKNVLLFNSWPHNPDFKWPPTAKPFEHIAGGENAGN